jgi:hypothetical protein
MHLFKNEDLFESDVKYTIYLSQKDEIIDLSVINKFKYIKNLKYVYIYEDCGHYVYNRTYPDLFLKIRRDVCEDLGINRNLIHPHLTKTILQRLLDKNDL